MFEVSAGFEMRRQALRVSLGGLCGWMLSNPLANAAQAGHVRNHADSANPQLHWRERALQGLGTHLHLRAAHTSPAQLEKGLDAAVAAIRHVEAQFSLFDPHSAVSQLNREGVLLRPHPDFVKLLQLAKQVSAKSQGSFDVTVQPLWEVWQQAKLQGRLPSADTLRQALSRVGWRGLDISAERIAFKKPGMGVTLNGIAQGFASDLARAALQTQGIEHALIDAGEWSSLGQSPEATPWRIGVQSPRAASLLATLHADGRAIATSSDAFYRFAANDRHHHVFNPRTGFSPTALASVTVLAPHCALADALTKVMFMGSARDALQLARQWQVDVLTVDKQGRLQMSAGLRPLIAA